MRKGKVIVALLASLLGACATPERVVLLPEADGGSSAVVVTAKGVATVLDRPYAQAAIARGVVEPSFTNAAAVDARYGELRAALPAAVERLTLYFEAGGNTLTPASAAEMARLLEVLRYSKAAEVTVVGHTDRVGSVEANDALSLRRAELIRDQIVALGVAKDRVNVSGRGERDPLVATDDGVDEPRNRRVELRLR
jgi:outer membrane protein OmpA-like peptidoglycan-associated protein